MTATIDPTRGQLERLVAGSPEEGPIIMLNLLRFRDQADPVAGAQGLTGRQAYERYAAAAAGHLAAVGGRLLHAARCVEAVIGADGEWDLVAVVEYPSRSAFLAMVSEPEYQATTVWRTAALADSRLILCTAEAGPEAR
jgi:uncharacterized protein (DUF1330 family)